MKPASSSGVSGFVAALHRRAAALGDAGDLRRRHGPRLQHERRRDDAAEARRRRERRDRCRPGCGPPAPPPSAGSSAGSPDRAPPRARRSACRSAPASPRAPSHRFPSHRTSVPSPHLYPVEPLEGGRGASQVHPGDTSASWCASWCRRGPSPRRATAGRRERPRDVRDAADDPRAVGGAYRAPATRRARCDSPPPAVARRPRARLVRGTVECRRRRRRHQRHRRAGALCEIADTGLEGAAPSAPVSSGAGDPMHNRRRRSGALQTRPASMPGTRASPANSPSSRHRRSCGRRPMRSPPRRRSSRNSTTPPARRR